MAGFAEVASSGDAQATGDCGDRNDRGDPQIAVIAAITWRDSTAHDSSHHQCIIEQTFCARPESGRVRFNVLRVPASKAACTGTQMTQGDAASHTQIPADRQERQISVHQRYQRSSASVRRSVALRYQRPIRNSRRPAQGRCAAKRTKRLDHRETLNRTRAGWRLCILRPFAVNFPWLTHATFPVIPHRRQAS